MRTSYYMLFLSFNIFIGCKSINNKTTSNEKELKVINIAEFEYVFELRTIEKETSDTLFVLSSKNNFYNKYNLNKPKSNSTEQLILNNTYRFEVLPIKPQVSTMQQLGAYIIVENDTLWKGANYKEAPKFYSSQNTVGLLYCN